MVNTDELKVYYCGDPKHLDCGQWTGSFGENACLAKYWIPRETLQMNQITPHCIDCEDRFGTCHFCCGVQQARPFAWGNRE